MRWNYEGIERKTPYGVLQHLMAALEGTLADPRVAYEHSPSHDAFGSMRIFESLPRLAHRATLEGVLLQTAVTAPYVYYIQSLVSAQGTSPSTAMTLKGTPERNPATWENCHPNKARRSPRLPLAGGSSAQVP